ncbi:MAG TPA: hemerythrin domain-containing protein [Rhodanobacteraceae bacterium]
MFKKLRKRRAEALSDVESSREGIATGMPLPASIAPGTEIQFHPDLIARFNGHHASLRKLLEIVRAHAMDNKFAEAQKSLQSFRNVLSAHLLEENVKLYTYMAKCLVGDPDSEGLITGMKAEMGRIGTGVMHFLNKYRDAGITPFNKAQFLGELDAIGATLAERMEREETSLYSMYMPPDALA